MDKAKRERLAEVLATQIANHRSGGQVYMNGRHNPTPSEIRLAERFMEMVEFVMNMTDLEFIEAEDRWKNG